MNQLKTNLEEAKIMAVINGHATEYTTSIVYSTFGETRTATLHVTNSSRPLALIVCEDGSGTGTSVDTSSPIRELEDWISRKVSTKEWRSGSNKEEFVETHKIAV